MDIRNTLIVIAFILVGFNSINAAWAEEWDRGTYHVVSLIFLFQIYRWSTERSGEDGK